MSKKITLPLIVSLFLIWCQTNFAQEPNKMAFDPFASDANLTAKSDKSTSGPVVPQVEFNNNDISMAFQIISDATGWSIFPTAEVSKAKINLWAKNISAIQLLDTVITMAGFVYHRDGDVITVMTYDEYTQYYGLAKQIFPLKFASASSVDSTIKPFLTKLGKSVIHNQTNTIVLYETPANLTFIESIIQKLDKSTENIIIKVIDLKYTDSESIVKILQSVFSNPTKDLYNKSSSSVSDSEEDDENTLIDTNEANLINMPDKPITVHANISANQLVVVGTTTEIKRVEELVKMIDVYSENMKIEVIDLKYADSQLIADKLQKLFAEEKNKQQANNTPESHNTKTVVADIPAEVKDIFSPQAQVAIQALGRTNQLIIKAYSTDIERIKQLVAKLDCYVEPITKNYQLTYIDASEIFDGLENILNLDVTTNRSSENREKSQGVTLITKTNSILLTAPPSTHRIMTSIIEAIDTPSTYETGLIRIYKLENADVEEVAKIVSDLLAADESENSSRTSKSHQNGLTASEQKKSQVDLSEKNSPTEHRATSGSDLAISGEFMPQVEAKVSVSKTTNSIIVQATARQHLELEKLIEELDKRRKQVLIEAMIVEIKSADNLNLGTELSIPGVFTSFGLSDNINIASGTRDATVTSGGTATISAYRLKAVIKALKQNENVHITSSPKILVNDNSVGYINNIDEEPTTQTNQGETTTTTSFAGYVEAGTQFAITPHISEKDYLRIEYQITLSSFGADSSSDSIPPARSTNTIQSEATVPNGNTIVIGGLQTTNESESVKKVPWIGDVPVLGWAFKNMDKEKQHRKIYLFITPHVIENEDFSDLKDASNLDMKNADVNEISVQMKNSKRIPTECNDVPAQMKNNEIIAPEENDEIYEIH